MWFWQLLTVYVFYHQNQQQTTKKAKVLEQHCACANGHSLVELPKTASMMPLQNWSEASQNFPQKIYFSKPSLRWKKILQYKKLVRKKRTALIQQREKESLPYTSSVLYSANLLTCCTKTLLSADCLPVFKSVNTKVTLKINLQFSAF